MTDSNTEVGVWVVSYSLLRGKTLLQGNTYSLKVKWALTAHEQDSVKGIRSI